MRAGRYLFREPGEPSTRERTLRKFLARQPRRPILVLFDGKLHKATASQHRHQTGVRWRRLIKLTSRTR